MQLGIFMWKRGWKTILDSRNTKFRQVEKRVLIRSQPMSGTCYLFILLYMNVSILMLHFQIIYGMQGISRTLSECRTLAFRVNNNFFHLRLKLKYIQNFITALSQLYYWRSWQLARIWQNKKTCKTGTSKIKKVFQIKCWGYTRNFKSQVDHSDPKEWNTNRKDIFGGI